MNAVAGKFSGFKDKQSSDKKPAKRVQDWTPGETFVGFWIKDEEYDSPMYNNSKMRYHIFVKAEIKGDKILTNDEAVSFRTGAGLANQLKDLKPGQLVKLTYEGKVKNPKTGMSFHKFKSQVADNIYQPKIELDVGLGKDDSMEIDWED